MQNESRPDDLLTKRIAEMEAQLADEKNKSAHYANEAAIRASSLSAYLADGTYTDENQTTWTRPTAYAYAMVCGARNRLEAELAEARLDSERMEALERLAEEYRNGGGVLLHHQVGRVEWGGVGIGLSYRTLRAALDDMRGAK